MAIFCICQIFCVGGSEETVTTLEQQNEVYKRIFEQAKIPYPSSNLQTKRFKIPKRQPTTRDILSLQRKSIVTNEFVPPVLSYSDPPNNSFWRKMEFISSSSPAPSSPLLPSCQPHLGKIRSSFRSLTIGPVPGLTPTIGTSAAGKNKNSRARYKFQSDRNNEIYHGGEDESSVNQPCFSSGYSSMGSSNGSSADDEMGFDDKEKTSCAVSSLISLKQNGFQFDAGLKQQPQSLSLLNEFGVVLNAMKSTNSVKASPKKPMNSGESCKSDSDSAMDDGFDEDVLIIGLSYDEYVEF